MLLSAVSVLVVAQSSSEIPEGLMNKPVYKYQAYQVINQISFFRQLLNKFVQVILIH